MSPSLRQLHGNSINVSLIHKEFNKVFLCEINKRRGWNLLLRKKIPKCSVKVVLSALQVQCSLICCYLAELLISPHKVFFIGHNNFMLAIRCFTYSTTHTHFLSADILAAHTEKVHKHFSNKTSHQIEFIDMFCKRYTQQDEVFQAPK